MLDLTPESVPTPACTDAQASEPGGWEAALDLTFAKRGDRTSMVHRQHVGPLVVQRPFYPEGGTAHVYLLHPPGGVVGGDRLHIQVACRSAAEALVTTPAAGKFYRSGGATARQQVMLRAEAGASLEWLPQETLFFDGAWAESRFEVDLEADARFMAWDIACFGRPAAGERFEQGACHFRVDIRREGRPLLLEHFRVTPEFVRAGWGLRGHAAMGTLYALPFPKDGMPAVRSLLEDVPGCGATLLGDLLAVRAIAGQTLALRARLQAVWSLIRPLVAVRPACVPRIWDT